MNDQFILSLSIFVVLIIFARTLAGKIDRNRIRKYFLSRDEQIDWIDWRSFGPGSFGGSKERIYRVFYYNSTNHLVEAFVKTSAICGIRVTRDRIVERCELRTADY